MLKLFGDSEILKKLNWGFRKTKKTYLATSKNYNVEIIWRLRKTTIFLFGYFEKLTKLIWRPQKSAMFKLLCDSEILKKLNWGFRKTKKTYLATSKNCYVFIFCDSLHC